MKERTETPRVVSPRVLEELVVARPEVRVLDVRTPGEYESVHIRGAYNVPLDRLGEHGAELRRVEAPVVLVCQSGQRARRAEEILAGSGMPNLHVLEGGMTAWLGHDLPVRRGADRLSLERQVRIVAGALAGVGGVLAVAVHPWFGALPALVGAGLFQAGWTGACGLALVLARLPYNRVASCDVESMVSALRAGSDPNLAMDGAGGRDRLARPAEAGRGACCE